MDSINIGNRKIYKAFRAFLWYWTHASTWRTANRTHCYFNRGVLLLPLVLDTCLDMKDSEQKAYLRWYCYPGFPLLPLVLDTHFDIKDSEQNIDLLHVSAPTSTLHWWGPKRPKQRAPSLSAVWQLHPTWLYWKRGSACDIVREVRAVRERERYRERERDGSDVIIVALKLALSLHFPGSDVIIVALKLAMSLYT